MIPISDSIAAGRFPLLNLAIIALNIIVFFIEFTSVNPDAFIETYALIPASVNFTNIQTLIPFITSMFLHGGLLHLGSNMLFLWVFGDNVETHFGWLFYLPVYLLSGIIGGLAQYMFMPQSSIPMLGASGAVAGILGAYYILFPHAKIKTLVPIFGFLSVINVSAPFMLGYWFLLQILSGALSLGISADQGGVAFWAHIGGFLAGIIFAKIFHPKNREREGVYV